MTPRWITAVVLIAGAPLAAQQRHTVTHEHVWLMQRVGAPTLSPEGIGVGEFRNRAAARRVIRARRPAHRTRAGRPFRRSRRLSRAVKWK